MSLNLNILICRKITLTKLWDNYNLCKRSQKQLTLEINRRFVNDISFSEHMNFICYLSAHNVINRITLCTNKLNEHWRKTLGNSPFTINIIHNNIRREKGHSVFMKVDSVKSICIEENTGDKNNIIKNKIRAEWVWRQENTGKSHSSIHSKYMFHSNQIQEKHSSLIGPLPSHPPKQPQIFYRVSSRPDNNYFGKNNLCP